MSTAQLHSRDLAVADVGWTPCCYSRIAVVATFHGGALASASALRSLSLYLLVGRPIFMGAVNRAPPDGSICSPIAVPVDPFCDAGRRDAVEWCSTLAVGPDCRAYHEPRNHRRRR